MAAWCALNPLALLLIPLEMVSQPDGIGSKPLAIENSQVKRLHRPLWLFALPGGGFLSLPLPPLRLLPRCKPLRHVLPRGRLGPPDL